MARFSVLAVRVFAAVLAAAAPVFAAPPPPVRFDAEALAREALGISALAVDPGGSRIAFGDARRASLLGVGGAGSDVVSRRGPVTALAFAPDGALLVGSTRGLERVDTDGRRAACALGPGETGAIVTALAVAGGFVAVGTARGAFVSRDAVQFSAVGNLPAGPVEAVALRARPGGATLFLTADGAIHETALDLAAPAATSARRSGAFDGLALPRARLVVADAETGEVVALAADALSVQHEPGGAWRTTALALPPGAAALRALRAVGWVWVASDRGLLMAEDWDGPFERAPSPAGVLPALALAASRDALYVGTPRGLLVGRGPAVGPSGGPARAALLERIQAEPSVQAVHGVAIRYLDLGPARSLRLRNGVDHRGLLPVVSLHVVRELTISRARDYDESFLSGGLRALNDRNREQGKQVDAGLALSWDLGDVAYHPEAIDVSRETREVIELRDDVLDEITQLYFERRRALLDLARLPDGPESDGERIRLRLRADELAAGLDAWTGGWFSRRAAAIAP